jgi:enoyl-CoA hydratase
MSQIELDRPRPHVAVLTMNRPERFNALSFQMMREFYAVLDGLESDLDTRVVIVTGAGEGFCSGFDLKAAAGGENGPWQEGLGPLQHQYRMQQAYGGLVVRLRRIPQPLVAAVNGAAAGGGLSIALACDLRIAVPEAKFNCAFTRIGLGGGEMGSSYFLPKLLGSAMAAELMYTGRMVHGPEALEIGLVSRLVERAADDRLGHAVRPARHQGGVRPGAVGHLPGNGHSHRGPKSGARDTDQGYGRRHGRVGRREETEVPG